MKALWTKKDLMSATNALDPSSYFLQSYNGVCGVSIDDRTINKGDLFIAIIGDKFDGHDFICLLYTSPSPRDLDLSRMPSSA